MPRFLFLLTRREQNIPVNFVSLGQVSITITIIGGEGGGGKIERGWSMLTLHHCRSN